MGQSGVRGSPELRSRWNSQGKEAMAQVCLGAKHFLFGQCWVDVCPHTPQPAPGGPYVCPLWSQRVDSGPCASARALSSSAQMGAQACAKFPHPKEASSCGSWLEEVIVFGHSHRALPPTLQQP